MPLRFVGTPGSDGKVPIEDDPHSPVLLLGDSHNLVFHVGGGGMGGDMFARGAGVADQLALALGVVPEVIGVMGSASTTSRINLYRKGHSDPQYIPTKKAIVWLFSAREFTGPGGWAKIPLAR
jgi:alginate O-acetyltransferase complex protein AlgJ